jgi:DNA-directed RNA polymerase specialized sigma24 family protein
MADEGGSPEKGALGGLPDDDLARLASGGGERALEAIFARHGQELFQFCFAVAGELAVHDVFGATVARAVSDLRGGSQTGPLRTWLLGLAHAEATARGDQPGPARAAAEPATTTAAAPPPADTATGPDGTATGTGADPLLARFARLGRAERTTVLLAEVGSFSYDAIGGIVGLTGDSVEQLVQSARQSLTSVASRSGPECEIIRQALSHDELPPLAQSAVAVHLERCPHCRRVATGAAGLGPALGRALPRISTAAMAFALREGLARAAVGGPSGPSSAARPRSTGVSRMKRSLAATAVGAVVLLLAVLALSSGRLSNERVSPLGSKRAVSVPWPALAFVRGLIPTGPNPPRRPRPAPGPQPGPGPGPGPGPPPGPGPTPPPSPRPRPVCTQGCVHVCPPRTVAPRCRPIPPPPPPHPHPHPPPPPPPRPTPTPCPGGTAGTFEPDCHQQPVDTCAGESDGDCGACDEDDAPGCVPTAQPAAAPASPPVRVPNPPVPVTPPPHPPPAPSPTHAPPPPPPATPTQQPDDHQEHGGGDSHGRDQHGPQSPGNHGGHRDEAVMPQRRRRPRWAALAA